MTRYVEMQRDYHIPVLLEESLDGMQIRPDGVYVDVTFGGGGHSKAILGRLSEKGHLYSIDQDADAQDNVEEDSRFTFVASNFRHVGRFMDYYDQLGKVDAILADLGVSSHHFDTPERGFSFRNQEALLDMRMNAQAIRTARTIVNEYEEERLADILYRYGELKQSRRIAASICRRRSQTPLRTVGDLLEIARPYINPKEEKKQLGMLFQALRIEVNDELKALEEMLEASKKILRPGGRLVVITYHSLEDRIVKEFVRRSEATELEASIYGGGRSVWEVVTRKPITPFPEEIERNPRARSAKLRIAQLKG